MRVRISKTAVFLAAFLLLALACCAACAEGSVIKGTLWIDSNTDGVFDKGENGLRNSTMILERQTSSGEVQTVEEITTSQNGVFSFSPVPSGTYRVSVRLSGEYRFTLHGKDSAALPASGSASKTAFFTVNGSDAKTVDIGITKSASSISFVAFEDLNANGGRRTNEPVIRGVSVMLVYEFDGVAYTIAEVTTNREGAARISSLSPGAYTVLVSCPEDYGYGPLGEKINQWYNCFTPFAGNLGSSGSFELPVKTGMAMGIGLVKAGKLTGKVWLDRNADGTRDGSDSFLPGFSVDLISRDGGVTRSAMTDEEGVFVFSGLQGGDYRLSVSLTDDWMFASANSVFSDPAKRVDSVDVSVTAGKTTDAGLIGVTRDTAVTVTAYVDSNLSGRLDDGDALMPSVSVALEWAGGSAERMTNGVTGSCEFRSLYASSANLSCSLPEGYVFIADGGDSLFTYSDGSSSASRTIDLPRGTISSFQIGVIPPSSVSGTVYEDAAGVFGDSSTPLSGFRVALVGADEKTVAETETGENGDYGFFSLPGGSYKVRVYYNDPYIASVSAPQEGALPNRIASQNMDYGETAFFSLLPDTAVVRDAALYQAGSLEGYVLLNPSYDSLATNAGGLKGVRVTLLDRQGVQVSKHLADTTDDSGHFYIKGINPGSYIVCYTLPEGSVMVNPVLGTAQWTSEPVTVEKGALLTVSPVAAVYTTDFSGSVSLDSRCTVRDPVSAVLTLTSSTFGTVITASTDDFGLYSFHGLLPDEYTLRISVTDGYVITGSTDGFVPLTPSSRADVRLSIEMGSDWRGKHVTVSLPSRLSALLYYDADDSGKYDSADSGVPGLAFTLTGPGGAVEAAADESGRYAADNLYPGRYTLSVTLPSRSVMTGEGSQAGSVWTRSFTLTDGSETALEIGILNLGSIGGYVWNMDGKDDQINGRPIVLLKNGEEIARTVSGFDGGFVFDMLRPGTYRLQCELPENYLFTRRQDTGDRVSVILNTGSLDIPLRMGEDLDDCSIGIGAIGSIGDFAWLDANGNGLQDLTESGMPGIRIDLYQYGELISSAVTDVYGRYSFNELYPGVYSMVITYPAELKPTTPRSDFPLVQSVLPESEETVITLENVIVPSGEKNMNCDLGFVLRAEGVYPEAWYTIPARDWTPYNKRK